MIILFFSTSYSYRPKYKHIVSIVKKHLPILNSNSNLRSILFVSRKAPNLVKVHLLYICFMAKNSGGSYKCGYNRCITCKHMVKIQSFMSIINARKYDITHYIVYLATRAVSNMWIVLLILWNKN